VEDKLRYIHVELDRLAQKDPTELTEGERDRVNLFEKELAEVRRSQLDIIGRQEKLMLELGVLVEREKRSWEDLHTTNVRLPSLISVETGGVLRGVGKEG